LCHYSNGSIVLFIMIHSFCFCSMLLYSRFMSIDIIMINTLTFVCWIGVNVFSYRNSQVLRSIRLHEFGYMLMSDKIKHLLYSRTVRSYLSIDHRPPLRLHFFFFPWPAFSNTKHIHNDIRRRNSIA
jgi:hypothetical protein